VPWGRILRIVLRLRVRVRPKHLRLRERLVSRFRHRGLVTV